MLWKWLAVAAVCYGLLSLLIMLASARQQGHPGMPPAASGDGWLAGGVVEGFSEFTGELHASPDGSARVVEAPDGNSVVRWHFDARQERVHALGIPLAAPAGARVLSVGVKAAQDTPLYIGVHESGGALYYSPVRAGSVPQRHSLPLAHLQASRLYPDSNGQLDVDQIDAVVLVHIMRRGGQPAEGEYEFYIDAAALSIYPPPRDQAAMPPGMQLDGQRQQPPRDVMPGEANPPGGQQP